MSKYDISISIITYNRKNILKDVIKSLENQTYSLDRFEIVIVDDGSVDGTPDVMKEIERNSPCNIHYVRQEINQGKSVVRNISIEKAESNLILFLEDDTIADKYLIEEHVKAHTEGQETAILGEEIRGEDSISTPFGRYIIDEARKFFDGIQWLITSESPEGFKGFITFNLSVERNFLLKNGIFDPEFKYFCEDIELGYRLCKKGLKLVYNKKAIINNFHPPFLDEYCSRHLTRGYFTVKFLEKHPGGLDISPPGGKWKCVCKDLVYPAVMRIVDMMDKYLKIPFPKMIYQKLLDYYMEKGVRNRMSENGDIR